jgi:hypothetical protein
MIQWLGYRLEAWQIVVWLPANVGDLFLLKRVQTGSGAHQTSYSTATGGLVPCGKSSMGMKLTICPPLCVEVTNKRNYTSTPPISLHGMHRDNFTFHTQIFSIKILAAQYTLQVMSLVWQWWHNNCTICVFFHFHFNTTNMGAYSLLHAGVLLKWDRCLIQVRFNFISEFSRWNHSFCRGHFFAHLCHLHTHKNDGERGSHIHSKFKMWNPPKLLSVLFLWHKYPVLFNT